MAVSRLEIRNRRPFADGTSFGPAGAYERLDGVIHFAVDPAHPANRPIVDLDRAARDAAGRVRFEADFTLLQPVADGRRRLLFYVVNRGRRPGVPFSRCAPPLQTAPPTDEIDPGDGFLLRRGWTVAMCGWQWDVERRPGLTGLEAPQALEDGRPIQGRIAVSFQPNEPHPDQLLAHMPLSPRPGALPIAHRPYPAADPDDPDAVMTVRASPDGPRAVVPRQRWRFARAVDGQPRPDDRYVWLEGGFEPGRIYEVVYRTRICPVVGTGLLAVRDCVSFLRHGGEGNPSAGRIERAYGFGVSQCGRFLRQYLYDGLNLDESGRPVFDGLIVHVAGARRGEFNHRFAQPSAQHAPGFGHAMPFASDDQTDRLTGRTDGLLRRQRALGGVPRIFTINTSSEYWRSDCSLIHTDLDGQRDLEPPAEERIYLIAGHQHGPGAVPQTDAAPTGARGANGYNVVDGTTALRAALVNLDRWVADGVEPPPSVFPRLADGTAVPREAVLAAFAAFAALPDPALLPSLRRVDLGPDAERGIGRFPAGPPAGAEAPYPSYVPAVDADGNEVVGVRVPDLAVPVGSHTGWVPRHPATGGAGQLVDMMGSTLPFAPTAAARRAAGDPRPAIAERYRDRAEYRARARAWAERLAAERYLLPEDVELATELALQRYDAFAPSPAAV